MDFDRRGGASLWLHCAILMVIFLEGAFGWYFGRGLSSLMLWIPITAILMLSLFSMINYKEGLVLTPELTPILIAIYALVLWRLITFFWTVNDVLSFKEGMKTLYLLVFIVSVHNLMMHIPREGLVKMIAFIVTFGIMVSVISYVYLLVSEGGFVNYGRRSFKVMIRIYYISNLAGAVVLLLGLWNWVLVFSGGRYLKLGVLNLLLTLFFLFGITSQAALGGFLASMSVVSFYYIYTIRQRMLLFYMSNLLTMFLGVLSVYIVVISTTIETLSTANGRIGIWLDVLGIFREGQWLTGVGSGASRLLLSGTSYGERDMHNVLFSALASGGIVELGIVVFVFAWLVRISLSKGRGAGVVLMAFVVGVFVRNQAESNGLVFGYLNNSWVFLSWYALISIIVLMADGAFITHESGKYGVVAVR